MSKKNKNRLPTISRRADAAVGGDAGIRTPVLPPSFPRELHVRVRFRLISAPSARDSGKCGNPRLSAWNPDEALRTDRRPVIPEMIPDGHRGCLALPTGMPHKLSGKGILPVEAVFVSSLRPAARFNDAVAGVGRHVSRIRIDVNRNQIIPDGLYSSLPVISGYDN